MITLKKLIMMCCIPSALHINTFLQTHLPYFYSTKNDLGRVRFGFFMEQNNSCGTDSR